MGCANSTTRVTEVEAVDPHALTIEGQILDNLMDQARGESSDGGSVRSEPDIGRAITEKWRVIKASVLYDINDDPHQFKPMDELPRGEAAKQLRRAVDEWCADVEAAKARPEPTVATIGDDSCRRSVTGDSVGTQAALLSPMGGSEIRLILPGSPYRCDDRASTDDSDIGSEQ